MVGWVITNSNTQTVLILLILNYSEHNINIDINICNIKLNLFHCLILIIKESNDTTRNPTYNDLINYLDKFVEMNLMLECFEE